MSRFLRTIDTWLFPSRLGGLRVLVAAFLLFNALVRLALAFLNGDPGVFLPWRIVPAMLIGALFDLAAATFFLPLFALLLACWPARFPRALVAVFALLLLPLCGLMVFIGAAELVFWNEFASRFNFIAVDYLIYTNEVIGNIRESYDMPLLLSLVAFVALALSFAITRRAATILAAPGATRVRLRALAIWLLAPFVAFGALDARFKEFSSNAQLNELAGDGYYDFWHAFRANEIDYERYYRTLPQQRALFELAREINPARPVVATSLPFDRQIRGHGPERKLNVVLITVESLSADFLSAFGNREGLTPRLDQFAKEGLLFTRLYATGTRTVRGLEALALSIPPTPGHSIVKRPDNDSLFTLGEVFKGKGYEPLFLYGGYGYFDNMNAFFSGNGYTVIDRTALDSDEITYQNIWGVADEDLFRLALRELDKRDAAGKRFFAQIMTVSNHRPFTYPEGRIDIPSHTGREGGVKYSDFAIGQFIDNARKRPWFHRTLFAIVADHTHKGRGRTELPPANYHIPFIVYAPGIVQPGRVDTIASQIDVGPTLLGVLNFGYRSRFFGHDILHEGARHPRALFANFQTVGYYQDGIVVELKPNERYRVVDAATGRKRPEDALSAQLMNEAISYYQVASHAYRSGQLKLAHTSD
jgi:phosphoglycerol transferase MdoB-like AlkP superfamily enzyme